MPIVKMPDGTQVRFPDDMPKEQIKGMIASKFPEVAPQQAQEPKGLWDTMKDVGSFMADEWGEALSPKNNLVKAGVFADSAIDAVPIAGPLVKKGLDKGIAQVESAVTGQDAGAIESRHQANLDANRAANGEASAAGNIAGTFGPMGAIAKTAQGAKLLGMSGGLLPRVGFSTASGAGISGADTLARTGDLAEAGKSAAIGGLAGAAVPLTIAGIGKAGSAARQGLNKVRGSWNPEDEAARRVAKAMEIDKQSNPGALLSSADEAAARANGQQIINVDRGGETTRSLLRSATNTSPEIRGQAEDFASNRFKAQAGRAISTLNRLVGGNADDLAFHDQLKKAARAANQPAYKAAYADPAGQQLYTQNLQNLMQAPAMRAAAQSVPKTSANRGALQGYKEIANPFEANSQGAYVLRRKADGSMVAPNLQFWDHVQRNLRDKAETLARAGKNSEAADIRSLRDGLLNELDGAVPSFKAARSGAAGFFGAEDALDAGRKFANAARRPREGMAAFAKMKPAEQKAFRVGYASELKDKLNAASDNRNIVQQAFGNPAAREMNEAILGKSAARELEAFMRVEDIMNKMRHGLGNSTTARQLAEMGMAGGVGTTAGLMGGQDLQTSMTIGGLVALGRRGAGALSQRVDERVLKAVGEMLLSETKNSQAAAKVTKNAMLSKKWMDALQFIGMGLVVQDR